MNRRKEGPIDGQYRYDVWTGAIVAPPEPRKIFPQTDLKDLKRPDEMPICAYINTEGLMLIRNRINEKREAFAGSDEELINKLVVFMGGRTSIMIDPHLERQKGYSVKLNIGIIAWETSAMDKQDIPTGHGFYQLLGVYKEYNATGRPSTDKSIRGYATIQKSNRNHPEFLYLKECFFAKPEDVVKVKRSSAEKEQTSYYWKKK